MQSAMSQHHIPMLLITCRKLLTFYRVLVKSKAGTASKEQLEELGSMRSEYVHEGANWKKEIQAGESLNITGWVSFPPPPFFYSFIASQIHVFYYGYFCSTTVETRLNDELRIINKEDKVVRRQGVEDLKELLYVARKLFALLDVTFKVLQGEKEQHEKLFRSLFLEFCAQQIMWTRKLNQGTIYIIVFILIMFIYCEFASILHVLDVM
jgi:hypothetical protein